MTAVLAAAARAVLYAVLVLAAAVSVLWSALSPPGLATMAWLGVMFVTVAGSGVALERLGRRRREGARAVTGATAERLRWGLWGLACRLPPGVPVQRAHTVIVLDHPDRNRNPLIDGACRRDCAANGSCWTAGEAAAEAGRGRDG